MLNIDNYALSQKRLKHAKDDLADAQLLLSKERYQSAVNRSYYAVFHAMRAVLALDGVESKKHSGVISEFRKRYIKTGIFEKDMSVVLTKQFNMRSLSDYDDLYDVSEQEAMIQFHQAEMTVAEIEAFLLVIYAKQE